MSSSNCSWLGIFKLQGMNSSHSQELLHVVRAVNGLKPGVRWKRADVMTEEYFMFFTVQEIAGQVRPLDTEVNDNMDLSI